MHCTKISHEFECQGQSSKVKVTKDKNMLSAADSPGCVRMVCARCKQVCSSSGRAHVVAAKGCFGGLRAVYVW